MEADTNNDPNGSASMLSENLDTLGSLREHPEDSFCGEVTRPKTCMKRRNGSFFSRAEFFFLFARTRLGVNRCAT